MKTAMASKESIGRKLASRHTNISLRSSDETTPWGQFDE